MNDVTKPPSKAITEPKEKEVIALKQQLVSAQNANVALSQQNQSLTADNEALRATNFTLQREVGFWKVLAGIGTICGAVLGRKLR